MLVFKCIHPSDPPSSSSPKPLPPHPCRHPPSTPKPPYLDSKGHWVSSALPTRPLPHMTQPLSATSRSLDLTVCTAQGAIRSFRPVSAMHSYTDVSPLVTAELVRERGWGDGQSLGGETAGNGGSLGLTTQGNPAPAWQEGPASTTSSPKVATARPASAGPPASSAAAVAAASGSHRRLVDRYAASSGGAPMSPSSAAAAAAALQHQLTERYTASGGGGMPRWNGVAPRGPKSGARSKKASGPAGKKASGGSSRGGQQQPRPASVTRLQQQPAARPASVALEATTAKNVPPVQLYWKGQPLPGPDEPTVSAADLERLSDRLDDLGKNAVPGSPQAKLIGGRWR